MRSTRAFVACPDHPRSGFALQLTNEFLSLGLKRLIGDPDDLSLAVREIADFLKSASLKEVGRIIGKISD